MPILNLPMKTVSLKCPQCQAENSYTIEGLKASAGRVECALCQHTFVVPKKKLVTPQQAVATPAPESAPVAETEANLLQAKIPLREKLARLQQQAATLATQEAAAPASAADKPMPPPAASAAEVPKVSAEMLPPEAVDNQNVPDIHTLLQRSATMDSENGSNQAFRLQQEPVSTATATGAANTTAAESAIEALLRRSTSNAPVPATLPNIDTLLKTVQQHTPSGHGPTQNIHIQAQSLVFNLVSGKDGLARLPQQHGLPAIIDQQTDGGLPAEPPAPVAVQHQDFNWTLASLVALTVLIVQLFYYLLIMR